MSSVKDKSKSIFSIGNKIFGSFLVLILLFAANAAIIFTTVSKINSSIMASSEVISPSREAINEMISLVHRSRMLITNWVYLQTNEDDKVSLTNIIKNDYPQLKEKLKKLMPSWEDETTTTTPDSTSTALMQQAMKRMDTMLSEADANIMTTLTGFDDYEDPTTKLLAADFIDQRIVPESAALIALLKTVQDKQNAITEQSEAALISSARNLSTITLLVGAGIIVIGILFANLLSRAITKPINYIKDVVVRLGKGELVEEKNRKFNRDEIGEMAASMTSLVDGLKATSLFAENIGKGKYDSNFQPLSEQDVLGHALLDMRKNLAGVASEDKKRNWATEGLARFAEVLRTNNTDLLKLSDEIIANLVKYLKANQGALYIIDDVEEDGEQTMTLKACYAWNRKKYLEQKIQLGEGLAGQVWQERDTIYLTDVPRDYIRITSGLGEANPTCVLIVPLKVNEEIYGVVEIASLTVLQDFEIDFVQKISESIASTISSAKVNVRTKKLLEESQLQAEQMRSQEEEVRQNMEELSATQEEMHRVLQDSQSKEQYLNEVLNASTDTIYTIDQNFHVISFNKPFVSQLAASGFRVEKGFDMLKAVQGNEREKLRASYKRAFNGEAFETTESYQINGTEIHIITIYSPLFNSENEVYAIACYSKDITEQHNARQKAERLAIEAQQTSEELKAQEEELRQNMEELSATQDEMQRILSQSEKTSRALAEREQVFTINTILSESDLSGTITFANDKLSAVSKYTRSELIGQPHSIFRHEDMPKELFKKFWETLKKGEVFTGIIKNRAKDGTHYWVDATVVPIKNEKGEIIKYIGARYHILDEALALAQYNQQAKKMKLATLS